jgi:hypothetical protein
VGCVRRNRRQLKVVMAAAMRRRSCPTAGHRWSAACATFWNPTGVRLPKAAPFSQVSALFGSLWIVSWNERGTSCASLAVYSVLNTAFRPSLVQGPKGVLGRVSPR